MFHFFLSKNMFPLFVFISFFQKMCYLLTFTFLLLYFLVSHSSLLLYFFPSSRLYVFTSSLRYFVTSLLRYFVTSLLRCFVTSLLRYFFLYLFFVKKPFFLLFTFSLFVGVKQDLWQLVQSHPVQERVCLASTVDWTTNGMVNRVVE